MIPVMLGNTNAEYPQTDIQLPAPVIQVGVTEQSIPEKIDDLYQRVQRLDDKVNSIVNQYEQMSQEHAQYSQKLNNIEQSQNVLQNEMTQLQSHSDTKGIQSNQVIRSNENPIVQTSTPEAVAVKEILEKYPDISKTINSTDMENYLKGEVPFSPNVNEKILSKATANDIVNKLQNPNISQEEKQLILQQHPEILQTLGNPSNINQYLDGNVPFPPQFKDELSQKILANNIVDKLNNPQTSPQERQEILQQHPEIVNMTNISPEQYKDYINGKIPFPPTLKDSLSQKFLVDDTTNALNNPNVSPQEKQLLNYTYPTISNVGSDSITNVNNNNNPVLGKDNQQNIVQNNKTPEVYYNNPSQSNSNYTPLSKDDSFAVNPDEKFARQSAQNIFNELQNANTIDERKAVFDKYQNELNFVNPSDKMKYISGDLPIDQNFNKQLIDNAIQNYNVPVYNPSILFDNNSTEQSNNIQVSDNNTPMRQSEIANSGINDLSQNKGNYTPLSKDDSFAVNPDEKFARQSAQNIFNELKNANTIDERKAVFDKYPNELNFVNSSDKMKYISGDLPINQNLNKQLIDNAIQNYNAPVYNPSVLFDNNIEQSKDKDINEMLNKLQNANTQDEQINIIEEYPQFKPIVQKHMINGTPLDINAIRNELLQNKEQYDYNNNIDLTTLSKEQLIDELQKCKDTCKLLQNRFDNINMPQEIQKLGISKPIQLSISPMSQEIPKPVVEQQQMVPSNDMISATLPISQTEIQNEAKLPIQQDVPQQSQRTNVSENLSQSLQENTQLQQDLIQQPQVDSNLGVVNQQQMTPIQNTGEESAGIIEVQDNTSINSEQLMSDHVVMQSQTDMSNLSSIKEQNNNNGEILSNNNLLDNDGLSGVSNESSIDSNNISLQTNNTALDGDTDEELKQIQGIASALNANSN